MDTIQIQAQIVWGVVRTTSGTLVADCEPLGLTLEADKEAELHSMIAEAQHVLFMDLLADGELELFLVDHGWRATRPIPRVLPQDGVKFDVPYRVEPVAHGSA